MTSSPSQSLETDSFPIPHTKALIGEGKEYFCLIFFPINFSLHWLIMRKLEIDFFCCLNMDIKIVLNIS